MTKDEWIKRCAEQFFTAGGMNEKESIEMAGTCLEALEYGGEEDPLNDTDPEEAATEEMSYWGE